MTLALLIPGLLMGGGDGNTPSPSLVVPSVHKRKGIWQPDVPTSNGPGVN